MSDEEINEESKGRGQGLEWTRILFLNSGEHCKIYFAILKSTVIVPGPGSRSYRVPTLPDPTGYYYCTLQ